MNLGKHLMGKPVSPDRIIARRDVQGDLGCDQELREEIRKLEKIRTLAELHREELKSDFGPFREIEQAKRLDYQDEMMLLVDNERVRYLHDLE